MATINQSGGQRLPTQLSPAYPEGTVVGQSAADKVGFFGATPVAKPTITGAKGGNAALTSAIAALVQLGLVTDATS